MPVRIDPAPATSLPPLREEDRYARPAPDSGAEPIFSAIVPACNEGDPLGPVVEGVIAAFEEVGEPFEILIVDDGSRDTTGSVADALAAADARVRVFHHGSNRGLGAAIRTAVEAARGSYLVGSPADSPLDADQIRAFFEMMEPQAAFSYLPGSRACDIAIGYRPRREGYRAWTRAASWIYRWMLRILFRAWVRDFNWISMYRRTLFERITIENDSFLAIPEIILKAKRAGMLLRQVPCPMRARRTGRGTVGRPRMLVTAFTGMIRLWVRLTFGPATPDGQGPPAR
jgi:glycosyltransferase involved in cell wall biosynthesis